MITELVLGTIALALLKSHKTISGIGRVKRRIYIEIEAAQNAGVRLDQKFTDLTPDEKSALSDIAQSFGWKQTTRSIESGKSYAEAYFGSLKRAYNAITGIYGIGATEHRVKNADGQVILRWSAPSEVLEHIKQEEDLAEVEKRLAKRRASIRKQRKQSFIATQPQVQRDRVDIIHESKPEPTEYDYQMINDYVEHTKMITSGLLEMALSAGYEYDTTFNQLLRECYNLMGAELHTAHEWRELGYGIRARQHAYLFWKDDSRSLSNTDLDDYATPENLVFLYAKEQTMPYFEPQPNLQEDEPANENTPVLTKQQEILQMFPYLKTAIDVKEDSFGMVTYNTDSRDNFNYVVWRQMFSPDFSGGEKVVAEGPIMAAYTESDAQLVKKLFAKHTNNYKTGNYRDGYTKHNKESRYTVKPIHKVNLDKIAGIGYADYYDYFG